MNQSAYKNIASVVVIFLALLAFYYGSYLPFRKGSLYIDAMAAASGAPTLEEFMTIFDKPLNFYSPVGNSELARFLGNQLLNSLNNVMTENVERQLITYASDRLDAAVADSPGLNRSQNLLILGELYRAQWMRYKNPQDFSRAEGYFETGLAGSPNRPEFLFGLGRLYVASGQMDKAQIIEAKIVSLWPEVLNRK